MLGGRLIMNYLDKLVRNIKLNKKKQKAKKLRGFLALGALGVAIGGGVALFTKNYYREFKNIVIHNVEDNKGDFNDSANDDENINKNEIKETLEKAGENSLGDVGVAMEHALEDFDDVEQSENEFKS